MVSKEKKVDDWEPEEYGDGPAPIQRITSLKLDSVTYGLLNGVKVENFVRKDYKITTFKSTDTVGSAVKALSDHKLLSAPVFDDNGQCLGFCDIRDIMQFIITNITTGSDAVTADALKTAGKHISSTPLKDVVNFSGQNPYIPVFEHQKLSEGAQFLRKPHVHRAAIINSSLEVTGILSQSDIIRHVAKHLDDTDALKELGRHTVKSLKDKSSDSKGETQLESISSQATAVAALSAMRVKGVSVIAVIDGGKLVGEFSCSDLRGLTSDNFPRMLSSVSDFLKNFSTDGPHHTVQSDATLKDLLSLISEKHCHHVWVVDSDHKPTSLISLTDVMMFITQ